MKKKTLIDIFRASVQMLVTGLLESTAPNDEIDLTEIVEILRSIVDDYDKNIDEMMKSL